MYTLKAPREIEKMKIAGRIVAECHALARRMVAPGVRTVDIDEAVAALIRERGGQAAFLGYAPGPGMSPYPASTCISVNDEVVHGIPNRRKLEDGDVVSFDVGVCHDGYYGDAAVTILCGEPSEEGKRLVAVCERALELAIEAVKPGEKLSDIGRAVQAYVEGAGHSVVRQFVGHGIGSSMHEDPQVPNFVSQEWLDRDVIMRPGLTIAIEPMVNVGKPDVRTKKNGWTVVTTDGSLSAHVEHTVLVTETGSEILTRTA